MAALHRERCRVEVPSDSESEEDLEGQVQVRSFGDVGGRDERGSTRKRKRDSADVIVTLPVDIPQLRLWGVGI